MLYLTVLPDGNDTYQLFDMGRDMLDVKVIEGYWFLASILRYSEQCFERDHTGLTSISFLSGRVPCYL
jgi:hypothetical protein